MTPTERERIEKEADEFASNNYGSLYPVSHVSYIAGAESEHDKVRNQAIDDVVNIIKRVDDDGMVYTRYLIAEIKRLKTIS